MAGDDNLSFVTQNNGRLWVIMKYRDEINYLESVDSTFLLAASERPILSWYRRRDEPSSGSCNRRHPGAVPQIVRTVHQMGFRQRRGRPV